MKRTGVVLPDRCERNPAAWHARDAASLPGGQGRACGADACPGRECTSSVSKRRGQRWEKGGVK